MLLNIKTPGEKYLFFQFCKPLTIKLLEGVGCINYKNRQMNCMKNNEKMGGRIHEKILKTNNISKLNIDLKYCREN